MGAIDDAAASLRAEGPAFTRRNLFHAFRRASSRASEATFERALAQRLRRGAIEGLVVRAPAMRAASDARAILLVDRPSIVHLFAAFGVRAPELAVVCIDGSPAPTISALRRAIAGGLRAVALFAHDAATVVYPFSFEPFASLVAASDGPVAYVDLGLPPLGAPPRRFGCDALDDETIFELEALPPAALIEHCVDAARALARSDRGGRRTARSR